MQFTFTTDELLEIIWAVEIKIRNCQRIVDISKRNNCLNMEHMLTKKLVTLESLLAKLKGAANEHTEHAD